jgi:AcrR family transcriptional regulator
LAIRRAAVVLFAEKGFTATSIRDLAEYAEVTSAALYHYIGSKDDLLIRIMRESLGGLLGAGQGVYDDLTSPAQRLAGLVYVHVSIHAYHPLVCRVVDQELRAVRNPERAEIIRARDAYESVWTDALAQGLRQGTFRVDDAQLARLALLQMCTGVAHWFNSAGRLSVQAVAAHFVDMALALVQARPPYAAVTPDAGGPLTMRDLHLPDLAPYVRRFRGSQIEGLEAAQ